MPLARVCPGGACEYCYTISAEVVGRGNVVVCWRYYRERGNELIAKFVLSLSLSLSQTLATYFKPQNANLSLPLPLLTDAPPPTTSHNDEYSTTPAPTKTLIGVVFFAPSQRPLTTDTPLPPPPTPSDDDVDGGGGDHDDFEAFAEAAEDFNLIPLCKTLFTNEVTPTTTYWRLTKDDDDTYSPSFISTLPSDNYIFPFLLCHQNNACYLTASTIVSFQNLTATTVDIAGSDVDVVIQVIFAFKGFVVIF
ncbi:hypothetical protein RHSIM_Rhsim08G0182400 [Rhododendron simsii]|uniref:Uncharacterized protein n=1 Tax=Rhododendron simsii TaxID=118357 RepID=A0A834LIZ9_RHOSS|nr:hypothetical protein RHSIM_Rhsim08G0182400 [Rhododendron simsii]